MRVCMSMYLYLHLKKKMQKRGLLSDHRRLHDVLKWGQMGMILRPNYS